MAVLGAFSAPVFGQSLTSYIEAVKPDFVADLQVPPAGWYGSKEEAFAAHQAWQQDPQNCGAGFVCTVDSLQPCPNQATYTWGQPTSWCWHYKKTLYGQPYSEGITGGIGWNDVCPTEPYYQKVTNIISGSGTAADPRYYRNRCERQRAPIVCNECPSGNPIYPASRTKRQVERDYISANGALTFTRTYNSDYGRFRHEYDIDFASPNLVVSAGCLGGEVAIYNSSTNSYFRFARCFGVLNPSQTGTKAIFTGPDAARDEMNWDGASGTSSAGYFKNRLQEATVNGASGWLLTRPAENRFVAFDSNGLVQWIRDANGQGVSLTYTAGKLTAVTDDWGRSLQIIHGPNGVSGFADPAGQQVSFAHATINQQASVTYQDGTTKTYVWDEPDWATGSPRLNRLTGIIDESGQRYASFGYLNGKAASTQHAGNADRFSITDARSSGVGNIVLTSPLGSTYTTTYSVVNGISRPTSSNQPAGSGCAAASSSTTYDGNGNRASVDDFNGKRACYVHALNRNLETTRVEGLPTGSSCSTATAANATLPTGSRKTTTEWHPDWHFKARVAEPGRITTNVYNGQPDPFNANSVASCAPVDALLPDGKPIAVLCKKVEQATTDADGSKGFGAVLHNGVSARQWTYTYNRYGQLLTAKGPRTDVNDTTTFSYYTDTTADHTMGDLQSVTDAAGNVTSYPLYNKHGQALRVVDSNGVATDYTYDLRQRLTSVSVGGQTTSHEYYPTGLLKRVTQPDGSYVHHSYDDAHRLVAINDNAGNRIDYTLDNAGNRTGEQVRDPAGALARQLSRSIDALGRVQQATGRE